MTCPIRTSGRPGGPRLARLLAVVLLGLAACGGEGKAQVIDWDLSASHTAADVGWPNDLDSHSIEPVSSVRIALPEGRVFRAGSAVSDVTLDREGDEVRVIQVDYEPATTEDAYRRALALAKEWGLDRTKLDEWIAQRRAQRAKGQENTSSRGLATRAGRTIGPGGPQVGVETRYSFDDAKPVIVDLTFHWPV